MEKQRRSSHTGYVHDDSKRGKEGFPQHKKEPWSLASCPEIPEGRWDLKADKISPLRNATLLGGLWTLKYASL